MFFVPSLFLLLIALLKRIHLHRVWSCESYVVFLSYQFGDEYGTLAANEADVTSTPKPSACKHLALRFTAPPLWRHLTAFFNSFYHFHTLFIPLLFSLNPPSIVLFRRRMTKDETRFAANFSRFFFLFSRQLNYSNGLLYYKKILFHFLHVHTLSSMNFEIHLSPSALFQSKAGKGCWIAVADRKLKWVSLHNGYI